MKGHFVKGFIMIVLFSIVSGCETEGTQNEESHISIGIMLSDVGLGDQSFSDSAFNGLIRARDTLGVTFDYRELEQSGSYDQGLEELIEQEHSIIIGLGFMVKEALEEKAQQYPEQQFVLIDDISEVANIASVSFKEHEGSFLAGAAAAIASDNGTIGFVGGADVPLINKFAAGFLQGATYVDNEINVIIEYANDFGNPELGEAIAGDLIAKEADVLYAAAGLTGVGVLQEAQKETVKSIGVDSDQYFIAEDSVMTSMMKYIDEAVYQTVDSYLRDELDSEVILGLVENGVGLAPFRLVDEKRYLQEIEQIKEGIISGDIQVSQERGANE
ncbi:BMP family ABC transporter substrate-binding protein [Alkalihalophilus lindianensis]|uniref:BMP family ABC transporter substrate-binding protein n=1 Tax=Alkalihalophilus lindianensis TaxID=1630542 RepID=A0ABU3X892_9BACI|nr:BMP family ABC transporter substrate-binding protein [Alkalihalophilus lindianensis]MDV2684116.1 BMP family ABC transporter substrate-binding protein [Alkalihalophilus lindianensis]